MKLSIVKKSLYSLIFLSVFASPSFANHTAITTSAAVNTAGKFYLGGFGGWGSSNEFHASQLGTDFFTEAVGASLAVNAFGHVQGGSGWLAGAQVGYQAPDIMLIPNSQWTFGPAIELEGYYLSKSSLNGNLVNVTIRPEEHNFTVKLPMKRSVFLTNFVLNANNPCFLFHPYIGFGLGAAILNISGASAGQTDPAELGVNHFNANNSDMTSTFAGQIKVGLSYDINQYFSVFAEYRWLYISNTHFVFGSTVYPTHVETSSWEVKLNPQRYNIGNVGIRFNL